MVRSTSGSIALYAPEIVQDAQIYRELLKIQAALLALSEGHLDVTTAAPSKPRDGDARYADGTNWNPGSGEGLYDYYDGSWHARGGGGGGGTWTEVEIDFGSDPVYDATFSITDASINSGSEVVIVPSGKAATGRTADDWQWDGGTFAANPGTGSATCYATFYPGPIVGRRKLQYQIGT